MSALVTFGETALQLSPRGDERLATAREARIHADGVESGAAVAAATLGGESTWISKLPASPLGRQIVGQIRQHGVGTSITWTDPDGTRQGVVFRERGRTPRDETVRYDCRDTPVASATPGDLPMDRVRNAATVLAGASTAVISEQAATTTRAMLRAAGGSGTRTAAALDYRAGLRSPARYRETVADLCDHLDVLVAAADHAETVFSVTGQPRELAHSLAAEFDLETVVVTRTDGGAVALRDTPGTDVVHERGAIGTDTVDPTGRQAAFLGAFLSHLADGHDVPDALDYGVAAAALACTVPGPLLAATRAEIEQILG
jgi:2-dehydro-3-deoxygluconokinase